MYKGAGKNFNRRCSSRGLLVRGILQIRTKKQAVIKKVENTEEKIFTAIKSSSITSDFPDKKKQELEEIGKKLAAAKVKYLTALATPTKDKKEKKKWFNLVKELEKQLPKQLLPNREKSANDTKLVKSSGAKLVKSPSRGKTFSYKCDFCNKDISTKIELINHQAKFHFNSVSVTCENCNLVYAKGVNHQKYCTRRNTVTRKR